MNSLSIVGRIGKVGELRYTPGGKAVVNFSVAVDNGKDSNGEKRAATWFEIALWEKQGEALAQYLRVGDRIGVTGQVRLQVDEGKDGTKYPKLTVDFPRVELLGESQSQAANKPAQARSNQQTARPANSRAAAASTTQRTVAETTQEVDDSDIPF